MTHRFSGRSTAAWVALGLAGAVSPMGALAQAPTSLVAYGTLIIEGGGSNQYTRRFTRVDVVPPGPGTPTETRIQLSPGHDTLVIRGDKAFGGTCGRGSDCWSTDICADGVCGWSGIEVAMPQCGDAARIREVDLALDDCVRLWALDNPSSLVSRANACMQVGNRLWGPGAAVAAACPQLQQYRDAYDYLLSGQGNVLHKTVRKGVATTLDASAGDPGMDARRVGEIAEVLRVIDTWFRGQVSRYGTTANEALFAATSTVTGLFFKSVFVDEAISRQPPPVTPADATLIAEKIQRSGLVADKQVLRAAFGPEMPLQTAPLLLITADAIQGLSDRTASFAAVQDIACRFRPCAPGRTSIGNYMKVIGTLAQRRDALLAAIAVANTPLPQGSTDPDTRTLAWNPVFQSIADQHVALENAVRSAQNVAPATPYSPATLESEDLGAIPRYAVPLANIVRPALTMSDAFELTGTFRPRPRQLVVGMDQGRNDRMRAEVDRLCRSTDGVIPTAIRAYQDNEREYIVSALAVAKSQVTADKAAVQLRALLTRYGELAKDMNGLRASKQAEEITFGDFMRRFEDLAPAITAADQKIEVTHGAEDIDLTAANARFNPLNGPPSSILDVAVQKPGGAVWTLARTAGDAINLGFTGKWAPTCALRNIRDPNGNTIIVKDSGGGDILTGPEGYSTVGTATDTQATSTSLAAGAETWLSSRLTTETCGKVGFNIIFAEASVKTCLAFEVGARAYANASYSSTSGGSTLNSFSWGKGIRSDAVPFPQEPVGSLLLVELPAGKTAFSDVRSVQVLTYPSASTLVGDSSDFYLVVNDATCSPVSDSKLGLRVAVLEKPGTLTAKLVQAMAESQKNLRDSARVYVDQGRLLPGQREQLRSQALNRVYALAEITSLSVYAESLRNLFEAFVNREIANIDREIELVHLERQVRALAAEEDAIRLDMASAQADGRVASLLGGLSLRNLDLTRLETQTHQVSDLLRDWMEPVVALRLASGLTFTAAADKTILDAVISLNPESKYVDNLGKACPAVDLLTTKLSSDVRANPDPVVRSVIVSIPDPLYTGTRPPYREVDRAIAERVWTSIRGGGNLEITITPSMFYENREPFSLQCALNGPVVRSMGYYLVVTDLASVGTLNSTTTTIFPDMLFPRQHELFGYTFMNGRYLKPQVSILMGNDPARFVIDPIIGNGGSYWSSPEAITLPSRGTSPFATYHLDLSRVRNTYLQPDGSLAPDYPFKNARALLVAFEIEAISQAPAAVLPGVAPCEQ